VEVSTTNSTGITSGYRWKVWGRPHKPWSR